MDILSYLRAPPWPPVGPVHVAGRKIVFYPGGSPNGWHKIETEGECLRLAAFHMAGYDVQGDSTALILGGLIHTGLAQLFARQGLAVPGNVVNILGLAMPASTSAAQDFYDPIDAMQIVEQLTSVPDPILDQPVSTLRWYIQARAAVHVQRHVVLAVEAPVCIQIAPDLPEYTMLLDLGWRERASGEISVVDHKSAARPSPDHFTEYTLSGQFYGQRVGADRLLGRTRTDIYVNLIGKMPGQHSASCRQLSLSPYLVSEFPSFVEARLRERAARIAANPPQVDPFKWPPRLSGGSGGGCRNRYRTCGALSVCWGGRGSRFDEIFRPVDKVWSQEKL